MQLDSINKDQRMFARFAGWMYFANYATGVFGFLMESSIRGSGDFAQRAQRIVASEHLFRTALTSLAVSWVLIVLLAYALYVTLAPVNKRLAQIALLMEICQASTGAVTVMFNFAILRLYTTGQAGGPLQDEQLSVLVKAAAAQIDGGFTISMLFLSVGSFLFFYLFYKSGYIPRVIAAWGVFASALFLFGNLGMMILPQYGVIQAVSWGTMGIAEVSTALWLIVKGIRPGTPARAQTSIA